MKLKKFMDYKERKEAEEFCIEKHTSTNHMYDKYLPYEFHLRMVVKAAKDFFHLLPKNMFVIGVEIHRGIWEYRDETESVIHAACWGHDLIEDTRCSFNDVNNALGIDAANIIYACTNLRGRNREERAGEEYYKLIRETKGASFVKLCDRIANVQYSKMSGSRMFEMYKKENPKFIERIGTEYPEMLDYLNNLFI